MARDLPEWATPLEEITRDDVIASGACEDGVDDWMSDYREKLRASMPVKVLLRIAADSDASYIRTAARLDGFGFGFGDGDGFGEYGEQP